MTSNRTILSVLIAADKLVTLESWYSGHTRSGQFERGKRHCMLTAIEEAAGEHGEMVEEAARALGEAAGCRPALLIMWNDTHSYEDVKAVYAKTIATYKVAEEI